MDTAPETIEVLGERWVSASVVERLEARVGELEDIDRQWGQTCAKALNERDAALARVGELEGERRTDAEYIDNQRRHYSDALSRITALEALVAGAYREGWSDRGGLRMESRSAAYQRRELAWESSIARASLADKDGDSKA